MPRKRKFRGLTLAATVAVIGSGALAAHASAVSYVTGTGSAGPSGQGNATAECAPGQKVLGGGVFSSGAHGVSFINATHPFLGNGPTNEWRGFVDAYSGVTITVDAICQGGGVASTLEYRQADGQVGAAVSRKTKTAHCPNGYQVTGGGVTNSAIFNQIDVKISRPVDGGTAWEGQVRAFQGAGGLMSVYAICATGGFANHLVYRSKSATAEAGTQESKLVNCPGNAKVVGGGAAARKALSAVNSTGVINTGNWVSYVYAYSVDAKFTTYAVCHT